MNLISLTDISLSLGDRPLFENVTLNIYSGEQIGFIGPNGAGKSSFLSLLLGHRNADNGEYYKRNELEIAYLPQIPSIPCDITIANLIFHSNTPRANLLKEYTALLNTEANTERFYAIQSRVEEEDAWGIKNDYLSLLSELGIDCVDRPVSQLSGGELRKVDIARVLASKADILLLDEPTNHLDLETVEWLEKWLKQSRLTYLLVTHDRSFLDSACEVILELENAQIHKYSGNWSTYLKKRAKRLAEDEKNTSKRASLLRRELEWKNRQPRARTGKDKKRLSRIENLHDDTHSEQQSMVEFSSQGRRLGKKVLELVKVEKKRNGNQIIAPFSYRFRSGERIGIAGPNGSGKTTLLSIVSRELPIDSGRIEVGVNTRFALLNQSVPEQNGTLTVTDYLKEEAEAVLLSDGSSVNIVSWMEQFGFNRNQQRKKLRYLSGGEQRRLQLLRMLMKNPNFLLLDEPTNDLDLMTLEMLENFLQEYNGCLLLISHDRVFLERIVDYFFILDGSGMVQGFSGTWTDYHAIMKAKKTETSRINKSTKITNHINRSPRKGLTFKEKQKMENLLEKVEKLEEELKKIEDIFSQENPSPDMLVEAGQRHKPLLEEISNLTRDWEELAEKEQS